MFWVKNEICTSLFVIDWYLDGLFLQIKWNIFYTVWMYFSPWYMCPRSHNIKSKVRHDTMRHVKNTVEISYYNTVALNLFRPWPQPFCRPIFELGTPSFQNNHIWTSCCEALWACRSAILSKELWCRGEKGRQITSILFIQHNTRLWSYLWNLGKSSICTIYNVMGGLSSIFLI